MWSKYAEKATDNGMFFSYGFFSNYSVDFTLCFVVCVMSAAFFA